MSFKSGMLAIWLFCSLLPACSRQPDSVDANGTPIRFADYQGKWLVINYWADWCHSCRDELPELIALAAAHDDKDLIVFGVNFDHPAAAQLQAYAKSQHINYPLLVQDPRDYFGVTEIPALPATILIDPHGHYVRDLLGPQTQDSIEAAIVQAKAQHG